jgi:hypothetical protein
MVEFLANPEGSNSTQIPAASASHASLGDPAGPLEATMYRPRQVGDVHRPGWHLDEPRRALGVPQRAILLVSLGQFDGELRMLAEALLAIKSRVVDACAACIMTDQHVTVRELELLRAISAKLGCPLPLLIEGPRS